MVIRNSTAAAFAALLAAGAALAQPAPRAGRKDTPHSKSGSKGSGDPAVSGTVKVFAPGRELVLSTPNGTKTYNLGAVNSEVASDLAVGDRVKVTQSSGPDGRTLLKVSKESAGR